MRATFVCCLVVPLTVTVAEDAASQTLNSCEELRADLANVPHVSLSTTRGEFQSTWNGALLEGCEIRFETNTSQLGDLPAPDFRAEPGSELYERGWRADPAILADGPGSGVYAIENRTAHCIVRWDQPSYVDDDGEIVVSETFTMLVQCAGSSERQR